MPVETKTLKVFQLGIQGYLGHQHFLYIEVFLKQVESFKCVDICFNAPLWTHAETLYRCDINALITLILWLDHDEPCKNWRLKRDDDDSLVLWGAEKKGGFYQFKRFDRELESEMVFEVTPKNAKQIIELLQELRDELPNI